MALDQFIQILTVAVPLAKAMPLVGQYLEGGLAATLEICKMAQGTKSLRGDCETLAERATFFVVCVVGRIDDADTASFPALKENVERFSKVVQEVCESLGELLQDRKKKNLRRRTLEWKQDGESVQKLSKRLEDGVARFTLGAQIRSHQILEQLDGMVVMLHTSSIRLEQGQKALLEGQSKLLAGEENDVLMRLGPDLSACYDGANRVPNGANSTVRGSESTCLGGTREQLLKDILTWVNSSDRGHFWLSGLAGTGKTTVALTVAKHLDERGQLLASFFILRDVKRRSNVISIISTIAYQIARSSVEARQHICRVLRETPEITSKSYERQLDAFIRIPLSLSAMSKEFPPVIVIDALDECDKEGKIAGGNLVPLLVQALPPTVKIVLTSRPEQGIESTMARLQPQLIKLHDMDVDVVQEDISHYLRYHLGQLAAGGASSPWPSDIDLAELTRRCGRLFVYAATIVRYLSASGFAPRSRLEGILKSRSAPSGHNPYKNLDRDVYLHVLHTATLDGTEVDETLATYFRLLVGTIVLAQDPLPISALANIVRMSIFDVQAFLPQLSSILIIPELETEGIRVFHLSFSDFVTDEARCPDKNFYICHSSHHTRLAHRCLELMNCGLVRDICDIKYPHLLNEDVQDLKSRLDAKISAELAYACRHWTTHLEVADKADTSLMSELSEFINEKLLYWVEVMSLLRELPSVLTQLSRAQSLCKVISTLGSECGLLLRDYDRLVREFYNPIKVAALHIYYSALVFAPNCPLVDKLKDMQASVRMISPRSGGWSALLRTIEDHDGGVTSIATSSNGLHIASGAWNWTVRVWDAQTGENTKILEGHTDSVLCVAFSPDGQHIVSGSDDYTVRVWDVRTGENSKTLEGHTNGVRSVAFSPDGLHILSGSGAFLLDGTYNIPGSDNTVRLWNARTGENIRTLKGHTDFVLSVAVSPDGQHIASGSWDKTVRIWDVQTGENIKTLEGHINSVLSVVFSPDGQHIVSGSADYTVRVWDAQTGENTKTLEGHTGSVKSVAFSPNGQRIVSGSSDRTMCVWDAQTGENAETLRGHVESVFSVAFAPDGRRIVSGSLDATVRVWDAQAGPNSKPLEGHTSLFNSVAFAPDGHRIISGSWDYTVRVWDAQTGENIKTLRGHTDSVTSVAFSPDGQHIVSGSYDNTVRVWDAQTGENTRTLEDHADFVNSVAFSPDGQRIVSGSDDHRVRIWDAPTGECIKILKGHSAPVESVAFSPDGQYIASSSDDKTVRVWDAQTGENTKALEGHIGPVYSVAFSPDGQQIVSGSSDHTVRVWDAQTGKNTMSFDRKTHSVASVSSLLYSESIPSGDGYHLTPTKTAVSFTVDQAGWLLCAADLHTTLQRRCWLTPVRRPTFAENIAWHQGVLVSGGLDGTVTIVRFSG